MIVEVPVKRKSRQFRAGEEQRKPEARKKVEQATTPDAKRGQGSGWHGVRNVIRHSLGDAQTSKARALFSGAA
jgi:hypothetical protein